MKILLVILTLFTYSFCFSNEEPKKDESKIPEAQRFLRLGCQKNNAQACFLLGKVLKEEAPEESKDFLQKACNLGKCEISFKKKLVMKDPKPIIKTETKYIGGGFQVEVIRKIASVEDCVDLSTALGKCRGYRCKEPHPLISEFEVIHTVGRKDNFCYYSQQLPKNQLIQCRLTDDQASEFEGKSQLEKFSLIENLIEQKICILRPIGKSEL